MIVTEVTPTNVLAECKMFYRLKFTCKLSCMFRRLVVMVRQTMTQGSTGTKLKYLEMYAGYKYKQ
jgi:hypothetical protein